MIRICAPSLLLVAALACTPRHTSDAGASGGDAGARSVDASTDAGMIADAGRDAGNVTDAAVTPDAFVADAFVADAALLGDENTRAACIDHVDNDSDSYTDCKDFDCRPISPCDVPERTAAACIDGFDNDGDGYTDCVDYGCAPLSVCATTEDFSGACGDDVDNDDDGQTDCADADCASVTVCLSDESTAEACSDATDNDLDSYTDCNDFNCTGTSPCTRTGVRIATFNVQVLDIASSAQHQAALSLIQRIGADVVCLNEVEDNEGDALGDFANAAGFLFHYQGAASTPMAGGLTNACISKLPIVESRSLSSDQIALDPRANETSRDFTLVRVEVQPALHYVGVFSVHLKSGFDDADYLRRQVESVRLMQAVQQYQAEFPGDAVVVMGDFNEEVDDSELGRTIASAPAGLPFSYVLGSDLAYPFTYQPFTTLAQAVTSMTDPTQEDSSYHATRIPSGRRIDYILFDGMTLTGDQVYNPCRDNGVDDAPAGNWLPLNGSAPDCSTAEAASDHRPVFADFTL